MLCLSQLHSGVGILRCLCFRLKITVSTTCESLRLCIWLHLFAMTIDWDGTGIKYNSIWFCQFQCKRFQRRLSIEHELSIEHHIGIIMEWKRRTDWLLIHVSCDFHWRVHVQPWYSTKWLLLLLAIICINIDVCAYSGCAYCDVIERKHKELNKIIRNEKKINQTAFRNWSKWNLWQKNIIGFFSLYELEMELE